MRHLLVLSLFPFTMTLLLILSLLPFALASSIFTVGVGKSENTGKKGLGFDPSSIHPLSGDTIVFEFRSGSHSVVQSTFDNPCTSNGGFNSGVLTVDDNLGVDADGLPTVSLLVNDTQPLWFFDDAGGLCNKGAVLSVNPTADQSDAQFKANAASATTSSSSSAVASTTISDSATVSASASQTPAPSGSMAQLGIVPELYVAFLALVSGLSLVV